MFRRIMIVLVLTLLVALFPSVGQSQSPDVFKIVVSNCDHIPIKRQQTGFRVDIGSTVGIVTALHGVVDCPETSVKAITEDGKEFDNLRLAYIDIQRDVVLLASTEVTQLAGNGVKIAPTTPITGDTLSVLGYPLALAKQLETSKMTFRKMVELVNLIPQGETGPFLKRNSPNVNIDVLSLEGHLLPGHSGAPIFNAKQELVGIGNGGIDAGRAEIAWAVPWSDDINWTAVSIVQEELETLRAKSNLIFSFSVQSNSLQREVATTICRSALEAESDSLNEFKDSLLNEAKQQSVKYLFGEFLIASENATVVENQSDSPIVGYIRTQAGERYFNHEDNLAEVCVTIQAYVTEEDLQKLEPRPFIAPRACYPQYFNHRPTEEIEPLARKTHVLKKLRDKYPYLADYDDDLVYKLVTAKDFMESGFQDDGIYCAEVTGKIREIDVDLLLATVPIAAVTPQPTTTPTPVVVAEPTAKTGTTYPCEAVIVSRDVGSSIIQVRKTLYSNATTSVRVGDTVIVHEKQNDLYHILKPNGVSIGWIGAGYLSACTN